MKGIVSNSSKCGTNYVVPDFKVVAVRTGCLLCNSPMCAERENYYELQNKDWVNE